MGELKRLLKSIDGRLATLERTLAHPPMEVAMNKCHYTCRHVAELSRMYGARSYEQFTIRLACLDRRIPDAIKRPDGTWAIPHDSVIQILREGLSISASRRSA